MNDMLLARWREPMSFQQATEARLEDAVGGRVVGGPLSHQPFQGGSAPTAEADVRPHLSLEAAQRRRPAPQGAVERLLEGGLREDGR